MLESVNCLRMTFREFGYSCPHVIGCHNDYVVTFSVLSFKNERESYDIFKLLVILVRKEPGTS